MKWIIYLVLNLAKLVIISGLVLLSLFVLPIIVLLLSLGIALSYMRDNETKFYNYKPPSIKMNNSTFRYVKPFGVFLSPQLISRVQHIRITRNKSVY